MNKHKIPDRAYEILRIFRYRKYQSSVEVEGLRKELEAYKNTPHWPGIEKTFQESQLGSYITSRSMGTLSTVAPLGKLR